MSQQSDNVLPLTTMLVQAERGGYAVVSFSPRYPLVIEAVLCAGAAVQSPLIVQASQVEFQRVVEEKMTHFLGSRGMANQPGSAA